MPRFYCPVALESGLPLELPAGAARHVQVLRLQPGDRITLFNGGAVSNPGGGSPGEGEYEAMVTAMGRNSVTVDVGAFQTSSREAARVVHLAVGMPANERMDWLVEKATELGVASIQPLMTERCVLRLSGERAEKKIAHWQSVAVAACEQSGRNLVPRVHEVRSYAQWLAEQLPIEDAPMQRCVLSLQAGAQPVLNLSRQAGPGKTPFVFLSGPEGGLSPAEEKAATERGYAPVTLGPRVLRAETAALAALAALTLLE